MDRHHAVLIRMDEHVPEKNLFQYGTYGSFVHIGQTGSFWHSRPYVIIAAYLSCSFCSMPSASIACACVHPKLDMSFCMLFCKPLCSASFAAASATVLSWRRRISSSSYKVNMMFFTVRLSVLLAVSSSNAATFLRRL